MADSELVLNDVLCFLMCKFGKIAIKPLKSSVLDFFKIEDICDAKSQLLRDSTDEFDGSTAYSR